jgi:hypothetical protein
VQTVQLNSQVFGLGMVVIGWLVACGSGEGERPKTRERNNKTINFFLKKIILNKIENLFDCV